MKKLLIAALALTMGVSCMAFAACGSEGADEELAKNVIQNVIELHSDIGVETPNDYEVYGQVKFEGESYAVSWSATSNVDLNGIVDIGKMNETTKKIKVSIGEPTVAVEYKLTASVTVGKVTESTSFDKKVPAASATSTVAEVKAILATLKENTTYQENGADKVFYVKGYVTDAGAINGNYGLKDVYIADTQGASQADSVYVYNINWGGALEKSSTNPLHVNDVVVVKGYLKNYNGKLQIAQSGSGSSATYPEITSWKQAELSDKEKVAAAKAEVSLAATRFVKAQDVTLTETLSGATLTWAVKGTSDLVSIEGYKLKIKVPATPGEEKVTITVTIECGAEKDTKDFELTLVNTGELVLDHAGTETDPFSAVDAQAIAASLGNDEYYKGGDVDPKLVYLKGYVVDAGSWNSQYNNLNRVYVADTYAADKDKTADDVFLIFRIVPDSTYIKKDGDLKKGDLIVCSGFIQNYQGDTPELTYNGQTNVTCVSKTDYVKTDADKVAEALANVPSTMTVAKTGDSPLPESSNADVKFEWKLTEGTAATVADGKINVASLPSADATVKVTVTATCGDAKDTKVVTVTIKASGTKLVEASLDFVTNFATYAKDWDTSYGAHEVSFAEVGVNDINGKVAFTNADKQASGNTIDDRPVIASKNDPVYVTLSVEGVTISEIEFDLKQWASKYFSDLHLEYYDGSKWVTCSEKITIPAKLKATGIPAGVTQVRLYALGGSSSNIQVGLSAINITVS